MSALKTLLAAVATITLVGVAWGEVRDAASKSHDGVDNFYRANGQFGGRRSYRSYSYVPRATAGTGQTVTEQAAAAPQTAQAQPAPAQAAPAQPEKREVAQAPATQSERVYSYQPAPARRSYRSYSYRPRSSFGRRDAGSKARGDYAPYHGGNYVD